MATGIRNIDPDATRALLETFEELTDGPDGYVQVEEEHLSVIKTVVTEDVGAEQAAVELEPIVAIEDLADAATDGIDDDVSLDTSHLLGFTRAKNSIKRVTPARLCAVDGQVVLIIGSLQVPVEQDGKELSVGRLKAHVVEDYERVTKQTSKDPIHFHFISFQDSESKSFFPVSAYVRQDVEPDAVKPHLKAGDLLAEILSAPGGGGAMRMNDFLTVDTPMPWSGKIATLNARESESPYAIEGMSYSVTLEEGVTLYLRGEAEKTAHERREKIEADLSKKSGSWQLKVTDIQEVDGKIRMKTKLVSSGRQGLFQSQLAAANSIVKGELPSAKEEAAEAEEAPKATTARRRNAFAKAKG